MLEQSLVSLAKKQSRVTAIFTIILLLTQLVIAYNHSGAELTFHLKGRASQCAFVNSKVPEDRLYIHYVSLSDLGEEYVDFSVQGPNDLILFQDERQQEHRILLRAHKTGMYTLCFRNEHSHVKFVTFIARLGAESGVQAIKQSLSAKTDPLLVGLTRIQQLVEDVRNAQSYIARRERAIRDIAEETNAQILWGSIVQIGIIVAMSLLQLRILKNSFSTRRQV